MNKTLRLSVPAILSILALGAYAPIAFAANDTLTPCADTVGAPLVNVTQHITNDVDSGFNGNWALDNYTRHIRVWKTVSGPTSYCAQVDYNGAFHAPAGVLSPGAGILLTEDVNGKMTGGYRASITGTMVASPVIPTTVDYQGDIATGAIPGYISWLGATFNSGYAFNYLNNDSDWSWTYSTPHNGTWVNAGVGSSGDITNRVPSGKHKGDDKDKGEKGDNHGDKNQDKDNHHESRDGHHD